MIEFLKKHFKKNIDSICKFTGGAALISFCVLLTSGFGLAPLICTLVFYPTFAVSMLVRESISRNAEIQNAPAAPRRRRRRAGIELMQAIESSNRDLLNKVNQLRFQNKYQEILEKDEIENFKAMIESMDEDTKIRELAKLKEYLENVTCEIGKQATTRPITATAHYPDTDRHWSATYDAAQLANLIRKCIRLKKIVYAPNSAYVSLNGAHVTFTYGYKKDTSSYVSYVNCALYPNLAALLSSPEEAKAENPSYNPARFFPAPSQQEVRISIQENENNEEKVQSRVGLT